MWLLQNINNKKESILFGLLGISLTTVGATLLYEFYKKDNDETIDRKHKSIISTEFKVPNSSVAAIIGKGGRMIREIEMKTGATIYIQKYNIHTNSNPKDRICVITGLTDCVTLAQLIIKDIIDKVPVIDTYEFYVPYRAVKHILGKGRQNLQEIQEVSNAKVTIDDSDLDYKSVCHPANYSYGDPTKDGKKRIIVHGTVEQIEIALALIKQKVQHEDGVDAALQDLRPIKVSGAYTKLLTDELRKGSIFSKIILSPLPPDDAIEVYVSAMETPGQFWIQIIGPGINYLESLVNQMSMYYDDIKNHSVHALKEIIVGQIVAAKCVYFDQWYRAEVTKAVENNRYEVFLLDYGVFLECNQEDILELRTDMLSLRLQAVECKLANVKSKKGKWNAYACKEFATSTWLGQSKIMDATVKGYIQRPAHHRRSTCSDAVVLCVELYDRHQNIKVGQNLVSLGLAEFEEDVHLEVSDDVTKVMKRQFLSVQLPSKMACLNAHVEEGEMDEDNSEFSSNKSPKYNSTALQSKESNEPVKMIEVTTSKEKHNDIVPEEKNEANISTLDTNKDSPKSESKSDDVTISVNENSNIVPDTQNEAKISTLNTNKNYIELDSKTDEVTVSMEKYSDIIEESKYEVPKNSNAEVSKFSANQTDAKPDSKIGKATSVEEYSDTVEIQNNEAEVSKFSANQTDAKPCSKPDKATSIEKYSDTVEMQDNEAGVSTLDEYE